jgi:quinol monooxygenase YgiN
VFGLIGKLKTHRGQRDALLELLLNATGEMSDMEGCYLYVINKATDDPDTIWITEVWRSAEDHQASLENEAVRAIITSARPLIAEAGGGFEVIPVGGKGIPAEPAP